MKVGSLGTPWGPKGSWEFSVNAAKVSTQGPGQVNVRGIMIINTTPPPKRYAGFKLGETQELAAVMPQISFATTKGLAKTLAGGNLGGQRSAKP